MQTLRIFLPYVRPYWLGLLPAAFCVVATSLLAMLKPWPFKFLIDDVLKVGGGEPTIEAAPILGIVLTIIGIAGFQGFLNFTKEFFISATAQRVAFALRSALFGHIQRLPIAFHDRQRTGDLMVRVTSDVSKVQELVTDDLLIAGTTNILTLFGILIVMLAIDWQLGLVAAISVPLTILTTAYFRGRIRAQERQVRDREGDIASLAQATMSSIRVVKAFAREEFEARRFDEETGEMLDAGLKVTRLEAAFSWSLDVVTAASLAALVAFGAVRVIDGALTTGMLVVFIQYMRELQSPATSLSKLWTKIARVMIRADRLAEVFNEQAAPADRPGVRPAPRFKGAIRFDHVSFAYKPAELVLKDVNLEVTPGQVVAIVGPTGVGKSTIASLLLGLYEPLEGRILIDGHDIRQYRLGSVVDQMSIVMQESLLFQATLSENIAYGRPRASFKDIQEAARLAYCEEFLRKLPLGLDTMVGERGTTLSTGQRQRIAIARAVIRDSPILILDEPTAGLDAGSEEIVMQALLQTMSGQTTIMIAHKLSTVRRADKIYVLEGGCIVEQGTHEELLARGGSYARAHHLQTA